MGIAEPELAAMQDRHRRGEGQAKTGARLGAAGIQPHEPLHRVLAVGLGDADAMICNAEQHRIALPSRLDQNLLGVQADDGALRLRNGLAVFDGILHQMASAWLINSRLAWI